MNASRKTKIVAQGIYLYAHVQSMNGNEVHGSPEEKAWLAWCDMNPLLVEAVKQEQYNLFDRVNTWRLGQ